MFCKFKDEFEIFSERLRTSLPRSFRFSFKKGDNGLCYMNVKVLMFDILHINNI